MPQAGFTPIQTYNSPTAGHIPVNTDLYAGELAINTTDEKLYFKNTGGTVKLLASTAVFTTTGSGSYVLATSPTITGHPTIEGVTSTGATGTGKFVFDSAPTITGHPTIEGVTSTGATGTGKFVFDSSPTLSGVTLSDGTANGVVYLNSSKVLTSGSALMFDGANFGVSGQIATGTTQNTDGQIRISNTTTRAAGNKYGIRFADNAFETNASIYVEQGASGSNAAALVFGVNAGTGGINLTSAPEQMRLTSTGLGIGTSSLSYTSSGRGNITIGGSAGAILGFQIGGVAKSYVFHDDTNLQLWNEVAGTILFGTNGITRATIDSSGNLLVGTTTGSYKITCNGEPGANGYTAWTNYSDERLKENIVDFVSEPVLGKMCELRPVSFNYNAKTGFDEETRKRTVSGFLAHEMQRVFPDMVGKTMIGEEEYLDTNLSNLTLYLVKAIQELTARIENLENKL